MNPLLRLAGWYADTVLKAWFPLEQEPSMDGLEPDAHTINVKGGIVTTEKPLTEDEKQKLREAFEECGGGGRVGPDDVWPEKPDPVDYLIAVVEDIRNLVSSAVSPEAAAECPGSVAPPSDPGQPNFTWVDLHRASLATEAYGRDYTSAVDLWNSLSAKFAAAAEEMK